MPVLKLLPIVLLLLSGVATAFEIDASCTDSNRAQKLLLEQLRKEVNYCTEAVDCRHFAFRNQAFSANRSKILRLKVITDTVDQFLCAEALTVGVPARVPKTFRCEQELCVPIFSAKRSALDWGPFDDERPDWAKLYAEDYDLKDLDAKTKAGFENEARIRFCELAEKVNGCGKKRSRVQRK